MQPIDYSIDQLIEWLTGDDPSLRREASNALTAIGEKAVIPLITALSNKDNTMLDEITEVLGAIGDKRAVKPLIKALYHCDTDFVGALAEALGQLKDSRAVEPLCEIVETNEDWLNRTSAARALGEIGSRQAFQTLLNALEDEYYQVRGMAAEALAHIQDRRAILPLIEMLNDEDPDVRGSAAWALGRIGDERALPLLEWIQQYDEGITTGRDDVKEIAAGSIEVIKERQAEKE